MACRCLCFPTYKDLFYLIALSVLGFFAIEGRTPCQERVYPYSYRYGIASLRLPSRVTFDISDEHNPVNQLTPLDDFKQETTDATEHNIGVLNDVDSSHSAGINTIPSLYFNRNSRELSDRSDTKQEQAKSDPKLIPVEFSAINTPNDSFENRSKIDDSNDHASLNPNEGDTIVDAGETSDEQTVETSLQTTAENKSWSEAGYLVSAERDPKTISDEENEPANLDAVSDESKLGNRVNEDDLEGESLADDVDYVAEEGASIADEGISAPEKHARKNVATLRAENSGKTVEQLLVEGKTVQDDYVRDDSEEDVQGERTISDDSSDEHDDGEVGYAIVTMPENLANGSSAQAAPLLILKPQIKAGSKRSFKAVGTNFIALFRAWQHAGWTQRGDNSPTGSVSLLLTKPISVVPGSHGKMISQISMSSCIGGTKGVQLRCRRQFAEAHKCDFNALGVSPTQYNLWSKSDCKMFFKVASAKQNKKKMWIAKLGGSYHGKNMQVFKGLPSSLKKKYGHCTSDKNKGGGYIVMDYVSNPVLLDGHKFDLRTYLLIASTNPWIVFHHDGFIRRSGVRYTNNTRSKTAHITNLKAQDKYPDHFWGFQQLEEYMHTNHGFPDDFMRTTFHSYTKHITNYVFQAARKHLKRRRGAFMLFGLDWMLDMNQGIHLLEANGNPSIVHYEGTGLTPFIWNNMTELLTNIHRDTEKVDNPTVASGYSYGGWDIVFNEAESKFTQSDYNPCQLREYIQKPWPKRDITKPVESLLEDGSNLKVIE